MFVIIDCAEYSGDICFIEKVRYLIADLQELVGYFFTVHLAICLSISMLYPLMVDRFRPLAWST